MASNPPPPDAAGDAGGAPIRALLVDDDETFLKLLSSVLEREGYDVVRARSGPEALAILDDGPVDVVISDLMMPGMDGTELVEHVRRSYPGLPVLLMTAFAEDDTLRRAVELGAADFIPKPASPRELLVRISRAMSNSRLLAEIAELRQLRERAKTGRRKGDILIGGSAVIQSIYRQIGMLARNDVTVLIQGESGTGKELVARTIHLSGPRSAAGFVVVNCGAIPENLLEDELFGHVRGAFTGAYVERIGVFEEADGGTVLLDEIGELPQSMQVKLLRFLQTPEFRRIGGRQLVRVNVKVLAATNRNLEAEVRSGRFREDLFYRINVVPIRVPPLRERREDIPLLVDHFVGLHAPRLGRPEPALSPAAHEKLLAHDWPGNVRELENVVRNLLITVDRPRVEAEDIHFAHGASAPGIAIDLSVPLPELRRRAVDRLEQEYLRKVLVETAGNVSRAAAVAGMDRKNFWTLLKRHGVEADGFRGGATPAATGAGRASKAPRAPKSSARTKKTPAKR